MIENIFKDENAHPIALYLACNKHLESGWETWISETINQEIKRIFKVDILPLNMNKLLAIKTLHISDTFWDEWEIYKNVILALNGQPTSMQVLIAPSIAFLMNGVEIANLTRKQYFDDEVARFTASCFLNEDVHYAPPPLDFCQIYISQPVYKCNDCQKSAIALPPFDGQCEECGKMYKGPKALNFKPKDEKGFNLTYSFTYDAIPVKTRFDELSKQKEPFIKEVGEDIQASKLIIARDYTLLKMNELAEQINKYKIS